MEVKTDLDLGDTVVTIEGVEGVITHCGVDAGGVIYTVNWQKSDGSIMSRWYRDSELVPKGRR